MVNFPYPLQYAFVLGYNVSRLGFVHPTGFVWDAYFNLKHDERVDPLATYGVTPAQADELLRLNRLADEAAAAAQNAALQYLQQALGSDASASMELVLQSRDVHRDWVKATGAALVMSLNPPASQPVSGPVAPAATDAPSAATQPPAAA